MTIERKYNPEFFSKKGKQASFDKGTRKVKGCIQDKPDPPKTRPDSKKGKEARRSEIASVFQEQFVLRDEKERDFAKF